MECKLWSNNKNKRLLVFFAGWGSDENLFPPPATGGYDYMLCYNFGNPDFDFSIIEKYEKEIMAIGCFACYLHRVVAFMQQE